MLRIISMTSRSRLMHCDDIDYCTFVIFVASHLLCRGFYYLVCSSVSCSVIVNVLMNHGDSFGTECSNDRAATSCNCRAFSCSCGTAFSS